MISQGPCDEIVVVCVNEEFSQVMLGGEMRFAAWLPGHDPTSVRGMNINRCRTGQYSDPMKTH
jgi:hypothetical protein